MLALEERKQKEHPQWNPYGKIVSLDSSPTELISAVNHMQRALRVLRTRVANLEHELAELKYEQQFVEEETSS